MQKADLGGQGEGGTLKDLTQICLYIRPRMMEMLLREQIIRLFKHLNAVSHIGTAVKLSWGLHREQCE